MGLFTSPNSAGVMNSLPPAQRGAGAGMLATFTSSASVLSIGVFFSLMIVGLSSGLPAALHTGLVAHGVPAADATRVAHLPPVVDAVRLLPRLQPGQEPARAARARTRFPPADARTLTGRGFFPHLISQPFHTALVYAFAFAIAPAWSRRSPRSCAAASTTTRRQSRRGRASRERRRLEPTRGLRPVVGRA